MVAVEKPGATPIGVTADEIAGELARCLSRFLDATADENVMLRAKWALARWEGFCQSDSRTLDLTLLHP